jgi:hypothetical protein
MRRSRLLLPALFLALAFAVCAAAHRASASSPWRVGVLTAARLMLEPRSGHTATLLPNGKVLIAGGMRRNQDFYKSAELYDPSTGKFQPAGEMNERRVGHVAVLLHSGKVLIAGGWIGHGSTDSAELYDPSTGKFTAIPARMTSRRGGATATLLADGDVLIAGGTDQGGAGGINTADVFHEASMTFHSVGPMHAARISHTATLLRDGRVLIVGGRGDQVNAGAEIYDPKTARFTETGSLLIARYKHAAGLLGDGRVLVAGGSDERDWSGTLNSAEIYDPQTGKFTIASPLHDSRFKLPPSVPLPSGQLLIAGGSKEVEVYDPASGKFSVADGQMNDARHFMSATRLNDGSVLLAGGYPDNDRATAQAWIFRPWASPLTPGPREMGP